MRRSRGPCGPLRSSKSGKRRPRRPRARDLPGRHL